MNISVVGTGYVGLVTGTCIAEMGNIVTCIDIDKDKIRKMKNGVVPIYEPGLVDLFNKNIKKNKLFFTTSLEEGVKESDIVFLALPTPQGEDGSADLSYVLSVSKNLATKIKPGAIIIDKSTVPVGTSLLVKKTLSENGAKDFDVVSNPEFLREGFAVSDFLNPDRIVIGTSTQKSKNILTKLYKPFTKNGSELLFMDEKSAEMTKYAANSFLATKISFMNEIANLCELVGANVDMVKLGIGKDPRIGEKFLNPGIGYGGSCFPKDVKALTKIADENNYNFKILNTVINVNDNQKRIMADKINNYFGDLKDKNICIWGLAFKPDTDDIREAPAYYIIKELLKMGAIINAYDPQAIYNFKNQHKNLDVKYHYSMYDAAKAADAIVIATEWEEFKDVDFDKLKDIVSNKIIFDGRNIFKLSTAKKAGFNYVSMGRKTVEY